MTAVSYKLDDGQRNSSKCFPARKLLGGRKQGAGHYLVEYRKAAEQKSRNVHRRIKENYKKYADSSVDSPHCNTLDGPFLLQLHCVDEPSDLCSVNISEQKLSYVEPEDLKVFHNVAYIDASVNSLSLDSFSSFVCLRELNLSLNDIFNMTFDAADFPHLEVLDLSYNLLLADDIVSIGLLPCLKALHLTGNHLHRLPPDLASSNHDPTQSTEEENSRFKALEVLMLDDNKLCSAVFKSLVKLKRLKHLNLEGNYIYEVPDLRRTGGSHPEWTSTEDGLAATELNINHDEHLEIISQIPDEERNCKESIFPELQYLNIANNRITEEKSLFAVAFFPKIQEIDIHCNPLTTKRRSLTYDLQQRLGVRIKCKKSPEAVKLPLKFSTDPKWKVKEMIPKVKKPLLKDTSQLAQTQIEETEMIVKTKPASEGKDNRGETLRENTNQFFLTQTADVPDYEFKLQSHEEQTAESRNSHDATVEKFERYKTLMDVKTNPDVVEPIGIQTAVRMLQHTLKNLNVYRDSKPKVDSIQAPYKQREKRVTKLPPLKPIKLPIERVNDMIQEIKESSTKKEASLCSVIHSTCSNKQEQKEALMLLRDMKTKYKMVHEKTMEQAAMVKTDRNTERNRAELRPVI